MRKEHKHKGADGEPYSHEHQYDGKHRHTNETEYSKLDDQGGPDDQDRFEHSHGPHYDLHPTHDIHKHEFHTPHHHGDGHYNHDLKHLHQHYQGKQAFSHAHPHEGPHEHGPVEPSGEGSAQGQIHNEHARA